MYTCIHIYIIISTNFIHIHTHTYKYISLLKYRRSKSWGAGLNGLGGMLQDLEPDNLAHHNLDNDPHAHPHPHVPSKSHLPAPEPAKATSAARPPPLYEFSLVEDLATGSSIYLHKYSEKAAAMEVRMSKFFRRECPVVIHIYIYVRVYIRTHTYMCPRFIRVNTWRKPRLCKCACLSFSAVSVI